MAKKVLSTLRNTPNPGNGLGPGTHDQMLAVKTDKRPLVDCKY